MVDNYKVLLEVFLVKVSTVSLIRYLFQGTLFIRAWDVSASWFFPEIFVFIVSKPEKKSSSLSLKGKKKVCDENEMLATANLADESSKPVLLDVAVKCNRKESF